MIRNYKKIIVVAVVLSFISCAFILGLSLNVSIHGSYHQTESLDKNLIVRPAEETQVVQEVHTHQTEMMSAVDKKDHPDVKYDTWSNKGAMDYILKYNKYLNNNKTPIEADPMDESTIKEWWQAAAMFAWYLNSPLRYTCQQKLTWHGGWAVCQDEPYTVKTPCLVYSFGIANDFSFDDAWGRVGCDVRSFDPSMIKVSTHRRSSNVWFYRYGLGDRNTNSFKPDVDRYVKEMQLWETRTLKTLTRELGHEGRTIDILKIDIESTEWPVLDNLIETDMLRYVRHLLIEYHYFPTRPSKLDFVLCFQIHTKLRHMGFREYFERPHSENLVPHAYIHQGEVFYVNANFQPNNQQ